MRRDSSRFVKSKATELVRIQPWLLHWSQYALLVTRAAIFFCISIARFSRQSRRRRQERLDAHQPNTHSNYGHKASGTIASNTTTDFFPISENYKFFMQKTLCTRNEF